MAVARLPLCSSCALLFLTLAGASAAQGANPPAPRGSPARAGEQDSRPDGGGRPLSAQGAEWDGSWSPVAGSFLSQGTVQASRSASEMDGADAPRLWIVQLAGTTVAEERLAELAALARSRRGPELALTAQTKAVLAQGSAAARLSARRRDMLAADRPLVAQVEARGGVLVDHYASLLRGLLVAGDEASAASWRALPGVLGVVEAPRARADLARAGPHIGADRLRNMGPYSGKGQVVAVLDSGIDYGHLALGGHGDPDLYRGNDPERIEAGSFPTAKVLGGVDLAGSAYAADCPLFPPPELVCSRFPQPDDDPVDEVYLDGMEFQGHGSHVAGIVASVGAAAAGEPPVAEGIAPGASLLAIKVFGSPRSSGDQVVGETALTVSGLEWLARHNLGEALDHGIPAQDPRGVRLPVTVLNLSLGTPYGSQGQVYDQLLGRLTALGITVVASAGNGGDLPFVTGGPGLSRHALSVAAGFGPEQSQPRLSASWPEGSLAIGGLEAGELLTPRLPREGLSELPLAYVGDACPGPDGSTVPPAEETRGKIALIARGGCFFTQKLARVQDLGALAAVVFSTGGAPPLVMRGDCGRLHGHCYRLPAVMIDQATGERLRALRQSGKDLRATLDLESLPEFTDRIAVGSSRGPAARRGFPLKPQVTAPGAAVWSVAAGSGDEGLLRGGTSMAAPQLAGLVALLAEARAGRAPLLGPLDLAALVMNQARPQIHGGAGAAVATARQGAGLPDAPAAALAPVLIRAGDIAELNFGLTSVGSRTLEIRRPMTLTHLAGDPLTLVPQARFRDPVDEASGYRLRFEPPSLKIGGGQTASMTAVLELDPNGLRSWTLPGRGRAEILSQTAVLETLEADGTVEFEVPEQAGAVVGRVPFYALARRQACAGPQARRLAAQPGEQALLILRNDCTEVGGAALYRSIGLDAVDLELAAGLDLRRIGLRTYTLPPEARDPRYPALPLQLMEFVIETRGSVPLPLSLRPRVYFDVDDDGDWDKVGQVLAFAGPQLGSFVTDVDPVSLKPDWAALPVDPRTGGTSFFVSQVPFDLDADTWVLRFFVNHPLFGLGKDLQALDTLGLGLSLEDATGDLARPGAGAIDTYPGDLTRGARISLRPLGDACLHLSCPDCTEAPDGSEAELIALPAGGDSRRVLVATCDGAAARLLLHLPHNAAGERLLALDYRDPVDPGRLLLPWLSRPGEP